MLQPGSLQVPATGKGKSRFSKALPAIPGLNTLDIEPQLSTSPPPRTLLTPISASSPASTPRLQTDLPPPPPPLSNNDPRTPIQYTPLPPLPGTKRSIVLPAISSPGPISLSTPTTPKTPKTAMMIPRRPVGTAKPSASTPSSQQQPTPQSAPSPTPKPQTQSQSQAESQIKLPHQSQSSLSKPLPQPQVAPGPPPTASPQVRTSLDKALPNPKTSVDSRVMPLHQTQPSLSKPLPPAVQPVSQPTARPTTESQQAPPHQRQASLSKPLPNPQPSPAATQSAAQAESQMRPNQPSLDTQLQQQQQQRPPPAQPHPAKQPLSLFPSPPKAQVQASGQSQPIQHANTFDPYLNPPLLPSPSESLSSLLSAYSRSSTESIVRSSDGTVSARESGTNESSDHDYLPSARSSKQQQHELEQEQPSTPSTVTIASGLQHHKSLPRKPIAHGNSSQAAADSDSPPPPPSKDERRSPQPASPTRNPTSDLATSLASPSPPRPQIWRRRSRSLQGSKDLPNLKLDYSHGSTAATQAISQAQTQAAPELQKGTTQTHQKTFSGIIGLPGRNVRPASNKEQPSDPQTMGSGTSKLKHLKDKFHSSRKSKEENEAAPKTTEAESRPSPYRPPTPEYQKQDVKTPILETVVSPVSPASSPEPAKDTATSSSTQLASLTTNDGIKPPTVHMGPSSASNLQPAKSLPDLKAKTPSPVEEPLPPISAYPATGRSSPALDSPAAPRGRPFEPLGRPSPRNHSARPDSRNGPARPDSRNQSIRPDSRRGPEPDSRFVRSSTGDLLYRGRYGTLYPEMKDLPEPNPEATRFPAPSGEVLPEGTIMKSRPLRDCHYDCFQRHKNMIRQANNNRRYPLTCQTCEKSDSEDRRTCQFCHLRVCESCFEMLDANKRDLRDLMTKVGGKVHGGHGTLSLSSPSRPGSALGLRMT
jgi:hypothetical protein